MPITILQKKKLEKDIKFLDKNEHLEILNIIKKNNQKFSKNSKGVFFNLKYIDIKTLEEIINFVEFCKNNRSFLDTERLPEHKIKENKNIQQPPSLKKIDLSTELSELLELKNTRSNNFTFKNYLDKISIVPKKEFKNKQPDSYPDLININTEFTGTNNRILKKCKNYENSYPKANSNANILEAEINI